MDRFRFDDMEPHRNAPTGAQRDVGDHANKPQRHECDPERDTWTLCVHRGDSIASKSAASVGTPRVSTDWMI